ncbi:MAG: diguanylate cyclase [Marinilabiliales bacterium]|nr:diguanylate cyclase [Marinilabiliales bacterium]
MYGTKNRQRRGAQVGGGRARETLFRNDDVISRYRGDKFFVLFPDIKSQDQIKEIIAKARSALHRPLRHRTGAGTAPARRRWAWRFYPNDGKDAAELVRNAETALYMAKESGRDRLPALRRQAQRRDSWNGSASRTTSGSPSANGASSRTSSRRWTVPASSSGPRPWSGGVAGFGRDQGAWHLHRRGRAAAATSTRSARMVLLKTCEIAASWTRHGPARDPDIDQPVAAAVRAGTPRRGSSRAAVASAGVDPRRLEFEITESGIMEQRGREHAQSFSAQGTRRRHIDRRLRHRLFVVLQAQGLPGGHGQDGQVVHRPAAV